MGGAGEPRVVAVSSDDTLQFTPKVIEASPGERLHVDLTYTGRLPATVMDHNWLLLKAGSDINAFAAAAADAKATEYVPVGLRHQVLAQIGLLGARSSGFVEFRAPKVPGSYPYLCSYPGHCQGGMNGVLVVK